MSRSKILDFYENQSVFITGGTGFMGKVLIEKLLRSTNVSIICVLMRAKKGKTSAQRLEEILKNERPDYESRVTAVVGDCVQEDLGLAPEDREELISKTNIVFHVAATVSFTENIKIAYDVNVKGTKALLDLCKKFEHLKSVVHTSTASVYCHLDAIDEVIYDHPLHHEQAESMLEKLSLEEALRQTPSILKKWINTYTFTKAMAESMIKEISDGLPIGIFRPAIVTASYKEPMESWVDSFATLGLVAFISLGIIRVVPSKGSCPMELVPVDLVISAMIACAWDISHKDPILVYNYVSSIDNPTTFGDFLKIHKTQMCRYPLSKAVWAPQFTCITNPVWYSLSKILYNRTLALFYDFCHILTLKKPQMLGRIIKLEEIVDSIALFLNRSWKFSNGNVKKLWDRMNDEDRELFPFDIRMVNWETYYRNLQKGIRVYLLNDPLSTLPEARIRMER
ncbi:hypothetical protein GEV33_006262 [Tenebrio molitor]|uniref:Fatty acyl-CoA reductase n=1 Tax=Tenebrio molitor TaxID=7067 RepID=A0A8J6LDC5_TENMO|nr:hypothetical protein GEV33_006262 [Tenebrio molitor]